MILRRRGLKFPSTRRRRLSWGDKSFLFLFLHEDLEFLSEWEYDSMAAKKDLDPDFLLKIDLIMISFSPEIAFFKELIFFDANDFSVSN